MCIHLLYKYSRSNTTTIEKQRLSVLLASDNTTYVLPGTIHTHNTHSRIYTVAQHELVLETVSLIQAIRLVIAFG